MIADFTREFALALSAHNNSRSRPMRLRLRLGVHHGDVLIDGTGFAGNAVITAVRLVDSDALRAALETSPSADLALMISDSVFEDTVLQGFRGLTPEMFRRANIETPKFSGVGWMTIPDSRQAFRPPLRKLRRTGTGDGATNRRVAGAEEDSIQTGKDQEQVDQSVINDVAQYLWPLVVAGAAGHVGEASTDEAIGRATRLVARVRRHRRAHGLDQDPATIEELKGDLVGFADTDVAFNNQLADLLRSLKASPGAAPTTVNNIKGGVHGKNINFGIQNR